MTITEQQKREGSFEPLIRAEESAALARFRAGDFEAAVWQGIGRASRAEKNGRLGPIWARPVWIAIAAGILLIAVGLAVFWRPGPKPDLARSIEDTLRLATGIEALEAGLSAPRPTPEAAPAAPDANNLAALIAGNRNFGTVQSPQRVEAASQKRQEIRPMSLEEVYRILFIDKSIERVLTLVTS